MATRELDVRGLRCPQPIHAIITHMHETSPGDVLEVAADCPSFEEDVRNWCARSNRTLLAVVPNVGGGKVATIQV